MGKIGTISDVAKATELAKTSDFIASTKGILDSGTPEAIKALQTPGNLTKIADAVKTVADYTNPITGAVNATKGVLGLGGKASVGVGSLVTGESPETLIDLVKNPQDYSKAAMEANSRGGLAAELGKAIDKIEETKSTTGTGYDAIRSSGSVANIPADSIVQTFADNGLKVSKDAGGKWIIAAPTADTTLSSADVAHFKSFLDQFGSELNFLNILITKVKQMLQPL